MIDIESQQKATTGVDLVITTAVVAALDHEAVLLMVRDIIVLLGEIVAIEMTEMKTETWVATVSGIGIDANGIKIAVVSGKPRRRVPQKLAAKAHS